jgi:hypothetical protein
MLASVVLSTPAAMGHRAACHTLFTRFPTDAIASSSPYISPALSSIRPSELPHFKPWPPPQGTKGFCSSLPLAPTHPSF